MIISVLRSLLPYSTARTPIDTRWTQHIMRVQAAVRTYSYTSNMPATSIPLSAGFTRIIVASNWDPNADVSGGGLLMVANPVARGKAYDLANIHTSLRGDLTIKNVAKTAVTIGNHPWGVELSLQPMLRDTIRSPWRPIGPAIDNLFTLETIRSKTAAPLLNKNDSPVLRLGGVTTLIPRLVTTAQEYDSWRRSTIQPDLVDPSESLTALKIVGHRISVVIGTPQAGLNPLCSGVFVLDHASDQFTMNHGFGGPPATVSSEFLTAYNPEAAIPFS